MGKKREKLKYTTISNVGYVDGPGAGHHAVRLWAHYVLIDAQFEPNESDGFLRNIRQIRGLTFGGLGVFTYWIKPECKVRLEDHAGNCFFLRDDGDLKAFNSGLRLVADDLTLVVTNENIDKPMEVQEIEVDICPFAEEVDREILKHWDKGGFPIARYTTAERARQLVG